MSALSLSDKLVILEKYNSLPKKTQREAASKLDMSQSILGRKIKNSDCRT